MAFVLALAGAAAVRVLDAPSSAPSDARTASRPDGASPRVRVEAELAADPFADPLARFSLARESPEGSIR